MIDFLRIMIILLYSVTVFAGEIHTIKFAPLPMKNEMKTIEDFLPLTNHLKTEHGFNIVYNYKSDYKDIIEGFKNKEIDIAYLGPLPFTKLKSQYPHVKPIIAFRQENGKVYYRCVISKFVDDMEPKDRPLKVALTQPLSTCGYYMTEKLFKKHYGKELKQQQYNYTMSHTNSLIETLEGNYDIAGASEEIAEKFTSLGMQILARSPVLPGFSLVVNTKTLSIKEIEAIKEAILDVPEKEYEKWGSKLMYGFESVEPTLYDSIKIHQAIPDVGNMKWNAYVLYFLLPA